MVLAELPDKDVVGKLFETIAPRFAERPGGYTRILRVGFRRGDSAEVAQVELVGSEYNPKSAEEKNAEKDAAPKTKSVGDRLRSAARGLRSGARRQAAARRGRPAARQGARRRSRRRRGRLAGRKLPTPKNSKLPKNKRPGRQIAGPFRYLESDLGLALFTLPPPPPARVPPSQPR